jgi:hypothetical protein
MPMFFGGRGLGIGMGGNPFDRYAFSPSYSDDDDDSGLGGEVRFCQSCNSWHA